MNLVRFTIVLALLGYGVSLLHDPGATVRYRVTLEVEADGQVHKGSSVWEYRLEPGTLHAYRANFRGDAIVVDLGRRGLLIGTLSARSAAGHPDGYLENLPEHVFRRTGHTVAIEKANHPDRIPTLRALGDMTGLKAELDCRPPARWKGRLPGECPYLVRFRDISDPRTVQAVDWQNLAAAFGPDVRLRRATIEITDDDVTRGIEKWLPWLERVKRGGMLGGQRNRDYEHSERNLNGSHFRRGK